MRMTEFVSAEETKRQNEYAEKIRVILSERSKDGLRPGAFVLTFGCQQNEADSERMRGICRFLGYRIVDCPDAADLILVNTCAVREHAEKRVLSIVGEYKHFKETNRDLVIGIGGCMTAQEHRREQIKFSYPYVDFTFGTGALHRLPELIYGGLTHGKRRFLADEETPKIAEFDAVVRESSYRAWVSIMYGCDNFCTYCIVPYVRGRERSRLPEDVIKEARGLIAQGYRDITLLGQNVNSYGKTLASPRSFASLLSEIAETDGDYLLHFMTSHPKDASDELIEVMATHDRIAKHFHLPMQSGSDRILRSMNRHYDLSGYLRTVEKLRTAMPEITLTTDIIVGFPGETEEDFEATLSALETVGFDMIYSFIYSPRKGTPAAEREDQVPEDVKKERMARMLAVQNAISLRRNEALVGRTLRVLVDGADKQGTQLSGRTEGNKIVLFEGDESLTGTFANVKITRAEAFSLFGEIIK